MVDAQQLAERYANIWNEVDLEKRRTAIAHLWRADGRHFVKTTQVQGHDALERRVTASHEKNVRDAGYLFRVVGQAQRLPGVVTFNWQMVKPAMGDVVATGLEFLEIDGDGLIVTDYQFIVG